MALTKQDIATGLVDDIGLNKREAKELVECFFEELRCALERNENVGISGFGVYKILEKNERPGRNPKTGQEVIIPPRRVVVWNAGNKLKNKINLAHQNLSND